MCAGWAIAGRSVLLVCRRLWSRSSRGPAAGIWVGEDELELAAGGQSVSAALTWIGGERGELQGVDCHARPRSVRRRCLIGRVIEANSPRRSVPRCACSEHRCGAAQTDRTDPRESRARTARRRHHLSGRSAHSGIAVACEAPHRCRRRGGPPTAATSAKPPWLRLDEKLATPEPTTHDLNRRASREWIYITLRGATVSYPRPLTLDAVVDGGWNDRDGN